MAATIDRLVVILGPTAAGKTALALELAAKYNGEIVCADSRTIYREMDIGTAKPTADEQAWVRHHLLDMVDPGERLSAAAFKALAEAAIADIQNRGKVPFLVGGSGLYIDAVVFDYEFPGPADPGRRERLEAMTDDELRGLLAAEDPEACERVDLLNRRRVVRAVETAGQLRTRRSDPRAETMLLGIMLSKEITQRRVEQRVKEMLEEGFIQEIESIGERYGWDSEALSVIGYRAFKDVALGRKTVEEGVRDFVRGDMALYKKQVTWFKRNQQVRWVENTAEADKLVHEFLAGQV